MADPPLRLLNFVSESQSQLEEARASGGARVEDGIDRPLYEILKENKDKQEAEFNDRFKHRPPKALDEDETEFLDQLEMFRKEQERQLALEEAEQLANFHVAIASRTITVDDAKAPINHTEEHQKPSTKLKRPSQSTILANFIRVKPHPKRRKEEDAAILNMQDDRNDSLPQESSPRDRHQKEALDSKQDIDVGLTGLVSYSDESEEDDLCR
ncbi:hypothetical protein O6H91_10G102800 [Diphasiastrum complanatum]|uniref:Uncharacterized protein n=1 Tax=Diphasiastrum complanatum TaxID=34168 RepID=A0ACC2CK47_DIPCM|nr:hypothetical protein O6H91_10G102800 [Diphasiastrum complanatum]